MSELTLNDKFRIACGLTFDVDSLIDSKLTEDATEDQKKEIYEHIVWNLPDGCIRKDGYRSEEIKDAVEALKDKLGISEDAGEEHVIPSETDTKPNPEVTPTEEEKQSTIEVIPESEEK